MSEENKLRIHAQITPEEAMPAPESTGTIRWRSVPHPKQKRPHEKKQRTHEKLTFGDRLLRNSAIACAVLLGVLAVGNIDHPWARQTSEAVERALTMHIDLDESIGRLSFVRELMPESALVFLNLSGGSEFAVPISGELSHEFSETQPWLIFACIPESSVCAIADGTVTAVSPLSDGETVGILVDHGSGLESVYAYLSDACVQPGDAVERGQMLGTTDATLYFELRDQETAVDPTERMGL